jgi:phosphatidate cytidylyltransferase
VSHPPWGDLSVRLLSATVLAPVALICVWLGGWFWALLVAAAGAGLITEWRLLSRRLRAPLVFASGVVYILLSAAALLWLRVDAGAGRANVVFVLLVVWATDIGAYLIGRLVGGIPLAPSISPAKTWSGAAGGLACALGVGLGAAQISLDSVWRALAVAAGLSIVAQAGDLLESGVKRHFGVKDSSRLIPGHGGLLDRLDGLLAAAPVAALLAATLGRGVELWQ